jgi:nitrogen PTS system EIIA component
MTDLTDLLRPEGVLHGWGATTRKALFQQVGVLAETGAGDPSSVDASPLPPNPLSLSPLDARLVADRLAEREKLGSTGFGNGVAIPHARIDGLPGVRGFFVRLAQPIDFDAVDGLPVDLVFALLSPADAGGDHLKALARVSRRLRHAPFLAKLRGAGSRDALWALFATDDARDAD